MEGGCSTEEEGMDGRVLARGCMIELDLSLRGVGFGGCRGLRQGPSEWETWFYS